MTFFEIILVENMVLTRAENFGHLYVAHRFTVKLEHNIFIEGSLADRDEFLV